MITFEGISKRFGSKVVLDNVSGSFDRGVTSLIIGMSGQGKSVLLKCVVGLIKPDEGKVAFDERDMINGSAEVLREIRQDIGMLFQGSALFDSKTVEENVRFPLDIMTELTMAEKMDRVKVSLQRVALDGAGKKFPSELSGGMKKRVGIARAIVLNPKYLFCDEPNSGLDPQTSIRIDELIKEITEEYQTTTVVVTHDMNSVVGIGQQIMFLHDSHILWRGTSKEILEGSGQELNDFIFASELMQALRSMHLAESRVSQ